MKRLPILLFALLLCSNVLYSQNVETLHLKNAASFSDKNGWVGNTDLTMFTRLEDAEYVIAPRQINPDVSGQITKLKFYHHPYEEYNTTSYTIKIYEGADLQWFNQNLHLYEYASCGTQVYSQEYTASGDGWQTVELTTPYTIPAGEFWVGVQMDGMGTVAFGGAANAVENQYLFTEMNNYNWYWSPTYFYDSSLGQDVLYSLGLAVYTQDGTGLDDSEVAVSIYPNPTSDKTHIVADDLESISILDLSGRIIRKVSVSGNETLLDLSDLDTGLYFLNIVTKKGSFVKRVNVVR